MQPKQKLVPEDVCEVRHKALLEDMREVKTDLRLITEQLNKHTVETAGHTSELKVCVRTVKKGMDIMQTSINTLVANCTKTTQEQKPKGGIYIEKAVALKILSVVSGALILIYVIVFKGDSELVTSSAIKILGG